MVGHFKKVHLGKGGEELFFPFFPNISGKKPPKGSIGKLDHRTVFIGIFCLFNKRRQKG